MSIEALAQSRFILMRNRLNGASKNVIFNGIKLVGISKGFRVGNNDNIPFGNDNNLESITLLGEELGGEKPEYGKHIYVGGIDRIIKSASTDALGLIWSIKHVEAYDLWCDITGSMYISGVLEEISESIKVRIENPEQIELDTETNNIISNKFTVYFRKSDWNYEESPIVGLTLEFSDRNNLGIEKIEEVDGDYKLLCCEV